MENIKDSGKHKGAFIAVDEQELRKHVAEVVRQSVEETLNAV